MEQRLQESKIKLMEVHRMAVIKWIFIICMVLYTLDKILDGINNKFIRNEDRLINLIEMIFGIMLTFIIFKF